MWNQFVCGNVSPVHAFCIPPGAINWVSRELPCVVYAQEGTLCDIMLWDIERDDAEIAVFFEHFYSQKHENIKVKKPYLFSNILVKKINKKKKIWNLRTF